jgi:hypothetical protein
MATSIGYTATVEECVAIKDDKARLQCYDRLFLKSPGNTPASPAEAISPTKELQSEEVKADPKPVNPTPSEPSQGSNNEDWFGMEYRAASATPDAIESTAIGDFKNWTKNMQIRLENGQLWKVTSSGSLYYKISNPKVVIEKGALGAFYMGIEGINRRLKVKRIE